MASRNAPQQRMLDPLSEVPADAVADQCEPAQPVQAAREPQHTDDWHRRNDARALELQLVDFRARGWM